MTKSSTATDATKAGFIIAVSVAALLTTGCGVPMAEQASRTANESETQRFHEYRAKDLNGKLVTIPGNGSSHHVLVLVAFKREQQKVIDGWLAKAKPLMAESGELDFLELPVIRKMNSVSRWFLYHGMRSGIKGKDTRQRVVTLHLDKKQFREDLNIPNEDHVHVFLVRRADRAILWRIQGKASPASVAALKARLGQVRHARHEPSASRLAVTR